MGKRRLTWTPSGKDERQATSRWTTRAMVAGPAMVIGALIVVVAIQSGGRAAAGAPAAAHVGGPAPDFTLRLFNGESIRLSSLKGKPVLVNFWHSG